MGISVGVCGYIAGDPIFLPVLIGMGVKELSIAPPLIPEIKYILSRTSTKDSEALVEEVLGCAQSNAIHDSLKAFSRSTMSVED